MISGSSNSSSLRSFAACNLTPFAFIIKAPFYMLFPFFHFCNNKNIFFLLLFLTVVLKVYSFRFNSCCHYNIPRQPNCQLLFWRKNAQIFVSFFYFKNINFWIGRTLIQWYIIGTIEIFSFRKHKHSGKKRSSCLFAAASFSFFMFWYLQAECR